MLLQTPGTAIGTSRDPIWQEDYEKMADILVKKKIKYVLFNGGNGTMDTCGKLHKTCQARNLDIRVMGIPRLQIMILLRQIIARASEVQPDTLLPAQKSCVRCAFPSYSCGSMEASGRNAGWITAASALAGEKGYGPDLIYLPERPFDEEQFIKDVEEKLKEKSGIVVVASEGLTDKEGKPVVKPVFKTERATYFGDVSFLILPIW